MKVLSAIYIHKNNDEQEKLVGSPVTSGDFNFAKWPFILSCSLRSKVCVCHGLCHSSQKWHMLPLHIRSWGEFLDYPFI